jgi:hypothetical protein
VDVGATLLSLLIPAVSSSCLGLGLFFSGDLSEACLTNPFDETNPRSDTG